MIKSNTAAEALLSWCDERGVARGVEEFTAFLKRRNLTYVLPSLLLLLDSQTASKKKRQLLKVTAGRELQSEDQDALKKAFSANNPDISSEIEIDPDLIAGVSVEQNGYLVEASFNQQLQALKNHLHT